MPSKTILLNNPLAISRFFRSEAFAKLLGYWMAAGLAIQAGVVLWPVGNYSTLVGQFLYLPVLLSWIAFPGHYRSIIAKSHRVLLLALAFVLLWLPCSALFGEQGNVVELALEALRVDLMIVAALLGIGFLRLYYPRLLHWALLSCFALAALLALFTLGDLMLDRFVLDARLQEFGFASMKTELNAVPAGIYFGGMAILGGVLASFRSEVRSAQWLLWSGVLLCLVVTLLTGTRTALVGLWVVLNTFLFGAGRLRLLVAANGLVLLVFTGITALYPEDVLHLVSRGGIGSWRPEFWMESLQASLEHNFVGAGYQQETVFTANREVDGEVITHQQMHSHSFYLQLLWWAGLPALAGYVVVLAVALRRAAGHWDAPLNRLAGMVLVYFCVVQVFDVYNVFTRPSYYWPWIWLPLGILLLPPARGTEKEAIN